jgi:myo-inositol-hexaphosphate 3-phosphohydrolase
MSRISSGARTGRTLAWVFALGILTAFPHAGCASGTNDSDLGGGGGDTPDEEGPEGGEGGTLAGLDSGDGPPTPELPAVAPLMETAPVRGFGDAADDPAIWVNPKDPKKSLVFGTDKTVSGGMFVFELDGTVRQFLQLGELNNVDLRPGFELDGRTVTLVLATNRTDDSLVILALDEKTLEIEEVSKGKISTLDESYGLCMYKSPEGKFFAFVNATDGTFEQFELSADGAEVEATRVRTFCVETQPEGCVVDDANQRLFVGEEGFAVWAFPAEEGAPETGSEKPVCDAALRGRRVDDTFGGVLKRDVEGMAIAQVSDDEGYLIVSSQGAHEFTIYKSEPPYEHVLSFTVWGGGPMCIDGVEETDGLDVSTANFGGDFSKGLFVVQDGFNGDPAAKQNFKFISFGDVLDLIRDPKKPFETNSTCKLGDYGGVARFAGLPPGPELTEEFCTTFCQKCADCYTEGDPGFSEGDCHYKIGKPNFAQDDCLEGCAAGANPADTRPLKAGWEEWACLDLDDAL